jgi:hypothetical protein
MYGLLHPIHERAIQLKQEFELLNLEDSIGVRLQLTQRIVDFASTVSNKCEMFCFEEQFLSAFR